MSNIVKNNHFIPRGYMRRVMSLSKNESIFIWDKDASKFEPKKINKISYGRKIYLLSEEFANNYTNGDVMYLENTLSEFESVWCHALDNFSGSFFELIMLYKKMCVHIHDRTPATQHLSKISRQIDRKIPFKDIKDAMDSITNINIDKNKGESVLLRIASRTLNKSKEMGWLPLNDCWLIDFPIDMPMSVSPEITLDTFVKKEITYKGEKVVAHSYTPNKDNAPFWIMPITSKSWIVFKKNSINSIYKSPFHEDEYMKNYVKYSPSMSEAVKLRNSMVIGGGYSKDPKKPVLNNEYSYTNPYTRKNTNTIGEYIGIEIDTFKHLINDIKERGQICFDLIFTDECNSEMMELDRIEKNIVTHLYANREI